MCRVTWCDDESRVWKNGKSKSLCETHVQYKTYCSAAANSKKEYLMYKVEKFVKGEHQCELCGFDPVKSYPTLHPKGQSSMLDIDHINSNIKGTPEGELPPNLQLICKHCHIEKSHREQDYTRKDYR
jgi:5-methylcytosine-specific restriction endonuclease McrA